jgi:hypothetical protein
MTFRFANRPRAIALILALAFALVGLGFAPAAMAMAVDSSSMDMMSAPLSKLCPDCKGMDHSKTMAVDCPAAVCSGLVAILPMSAAPTLGPGSSFTRQAQSEGRGVIIPPDPGPPRTIHLV